MGIGSVKSPFFLSAGNLLFLATQKNIINLLINSPVSGHPPNFSLVSAYGNNSRKRTALLTDTFFQFPMVSTYKRVDCSTKLIIKAKGM